MKFKEIIGMIKLDGWYLVRQVGSHQQYHHSSKKGTVTIAGNANDDVHPKTLKSILKQAQISSTI
jgi:predicted RNA binding protein YcfA (HicA-like mRNA interferase family)